MTHAYRVRVAASDHWSARLVTIRVHADSAASARAEALKSRVARQFEKPVVIYARKESRR